MYKMVVLLSVGIFLYAETYKVSGVMSNDDLSVRSAPGVSFKKIDALSYDAKHIEVLECTNTNYVKHKKWCRIKHKSSTGDIITGWVSSRYLSLEKESDESNEDRYIETDSTPLLNAEEEMSNTTPTEQNIQMSNNNLEGKKEFEKGLELYYNYQNREKESVSYFEKSMELGNPLAAIQLGKMYYYGIGLKKDKYKGKDLISYNINKLIKLTEKNDPVALYLLGYLYDHGIYYSENKHKAFKLYQKASRLGNGYAQNNLGAMYIKKKPKTFDNIEKGIKLYKDAIKNNNNTVSMDNLVSIYIGDDKKDKIFQDYFDSKYYTDKDIITNRIKRYEEAKDLLIKISQRGGKTLKRYTKTISKLKELKKELTAIENGYYEDIKYIRNYEIKYTTECKKPEEWSGWRSEWNYYTSKVQRYRECLSKRVKEIGRSKELLRGRYSFIYDERNQKNDMIENELIKKNRIVSNLYVGKSDEISNNI